MNFTTFVKEELLAEKVEGSELLGMLHTKGRDKIYFRNKKITRYFFTLGKQVTRVNLDKDKICTLFLDDIKIKLSNKYKYFKGAFIATGYISNPRKEHNIEILFSYEEQADYFLDLLRKESYDAKKYYHRGKIKIALKRCEDIKSFLFRIGAQKSFFEYENISIVRLISEKNNRTINLELANEERRSKAAAKQLIDIAKIANIDSSLKQFVNIRKAHPEYSNKEIAKAMKISLSSIKNKIKNIAKLAK